MLTESAKTELELSGAGEERKIGSARTCRWRKRGPSETIIFGVDIWDTAGIDDVPDDVTINPLPDIGSHKAVQGPAKQGGSCTVFMAVTDSSRVGTTVTAGTDVQKGCELALQMAKLVEPKLP